MLLLVSPVGAAFAAQGCGDPGVVSGFYKGLDPMLIQMTAYYRRPDRKQLAVARAAVEQAIGAGWTTSARGEHPADNAVR